MAPTRARSASPAIAPPAKRLKPTTADTPSKADPISVVPSSVAERFAPGLLDEANVEKLRNEYKSATPYLHCIIHELFQDSLLQKVKDECIRELSFTEKETDIYKVHQTGDLASLSYLSSSQLELLPSLLALRDALYSETFRSFLRAVTGCGPLSAKKQDMSVNTYKIGSHLLNHDDVIGSRLVSYILYMPLPLGQPWKAEWGGALELYPVKEVQAEGEEKAYEPEAFPAKIIPPSWNQFVLFEVQPGHSFHSVEEVVVDEGEEGRQRLSISGWFHKAQEGEEGYEHEDPSLQEKSSLQQLSTSTSTLFTEYPDSVDPPMPGSPLSEEHIAFLSDYLNPTYLTANTLTALAGRFAQESCLELHSFLSTPLAEKLDAGFRERDNKDGLGPSRFPKVPPHRAGSIDSEWQVKGPPHKLRYCVLKDKEEETPSAFNPDADVDEIMRKLQDGLFSSPAFRAWLALVTSLLPIRHSVKARRFRPGLDYTLATSEDNEARLDVVLGLTPSVPAEGSPLKWEDGEWGGWECYMAPHDGDEDPAVYRSGTKRKPPKEEDDMDEDEPEEEEDDGSTLLTVQPGFNRLLLVLRDEAVLRFVKYVSASASGSRWDVCGEWEIGRVAEDDGDE